MLSPFDPEVRFKQPNPMDPNTSLLEIESPIFSFANIWPDCELVREIKEHNLFTASILAALYHLPPSHIFQLEPFLFPTFYNSDIFGEYLRETHCNTWTRKLNKLIRPMFHKKTIEFRYFWVALWCGVKRTSTSCDGVILATYCHCIGPQRKSLGQKGCNIHFGSFSLQRGNAFHMKGKC